MTDKAKASEHDLREGSKPRCPKCGSDKLCMDWNPTQGYTVQCIERGYENYEHFWDALELADFAQFFPIAAILEENQRLRKRAVPPKELPRYTDPPDICPTCDTRSFISDGPTHYVCYNCHNTKLLEEAEAENQRLAKELSDAREEMSKCDDIKLDQPLHLAIFDLQRTREAAEAKLGKMREAGELLYGAMLLMRCSAELQEPPTAYECKKMGDAMQKWAALAE